MKIIPIPTIKTINSNVKEILKDKVIVSIEYEIALKKAVLYGVGEYYMQNIEEEFRHQTAKFNIGRYLRNDISI